MHGTSIHKKTLFLYVLLLFSLVFVVSCSTPPIKGVEKYGKKDVNAYSSKEREVFIIADSNWQDILSLVPVTVWTEHHKPSVKPPIRPFIPRIKQYPTLIYHIESGTEFDADSIIYFLQQYRPKKVTFVGTPPKDLQRLVASHPSRLVGAGLRKREIQIITPKQYLSYWKSFNAIVYVENDYEKALLASTYASYLNVPLIIKDGHFDKKSVFVKKHVICVGSGLPKKLCNKQFKIKELQQHYAKLTHTNKLVMVNPEDLHYSIPGVFQPEKSGNPINSTFSNLSLAAPIYASARHALLLSIPLDDNDCGPHEGSDNSAFVTADNYVSNIVQSLQNPLFKLRLNYLAIIASPKAIPYWSNCSNSYNGAADWKYGSIDNEVPSLKVGRIYSVTVSDVSSYVARALFYKTLMKFTYGASQYTGLAIAAPDFLPDQDNAQEIKEKTSDAGYDSICFTWHGAPDQPLCDIYTSIVADDYQDRQFVTFADHGGPTVWGGGTMASADIPWLDLPYTFSLACLTNDFWGGGSATFGPSWIRKGGISYHASIPSTDGFYWELWSAQELTGSTRKSLGEIATNLINRMDYNSEVKRQYTMLGDPVLIPRSKEIVW